MTYTTAFILLAASVAAADRPANHLAGETSPYLLQHAHNPVDWYPWGDEAFAKAKKENKLVFLSVGYSSCHWCHVMERESFENQEIADLLNRDFVSIKVDREERPDIDAIYIASLTAMRRPSGWPMSVFLTADGRPIYGATYLPPDDREQDGDAIPGFKTILKAVKKFRDDKPKELEQQADDVAAKTKELLAGEARGGPDRTRPRPRRRRRGRPQGPLRPRLRRLRLGGSRLPRPQVPRAAVAAAAPARGRTRSVEGRGRDGPDHPRPHGPRRNLRPPRRRLPPLQHRTHLGRAALREDALRQRPTPRSLRRRLPVHEIARLRAPAAADVWPSWNAT